MKKTLALLAVIGAAVTGCCNDYNPCCEPCCPPRCVEQRPQCCPKPHVWDNQCCDPSNYEL